MARIERVRVPPPNPRGLQAGEVDRILHAIPRGQHRDRLLFGLIASTGLRVGEALSLHVEDLDLTPDDEHIHVLGKGDRPPHPPARRPTTRRPASPLPENDRLPARAAVPRREERHRRRAQLPVRPADDGPPTAPRPGSPQRSTSSGTRTPPSSSTMASASRRSANASATRTSRPRCATPSRPTTPPTKNSANGGGANKLAANRPGGASARAPDHRRPARDSVAARTPRSRPLAQPESAVAPAGLYQVDPTAKANTEPAIAG